ncbi:MAG: glycosyl hydrolase [Azonexus sp.]|nr:glycosyl hydrolase [Azonexus sp.]
MIRWLVLRGAATWALVALCCLDAGADETRMPTLHPAETTRYAMKTMMLAAAVAGKRVVAVGDHGIVLLSDDDGQSWRQARSVPADVMLTAVSFADAERGWAVGHWGLILHTGDGGETWAVQRLATDEDRPLFGVHFRDTQHGVAVGLWSLILTTDDGGATWRTQTLPPPIGARRADLNLFGLTADGNGNWYAPSERGLILHSADDGATWNWLATGFKGSLWSVVALPDGILLAAGLRGALYRSADHGANWSAVDSGASASIISLAWRDGGSKVIAASVDGEVLSSTDTGASFQSVRSNVPLTGALIAPGGQTVLLSRQGPVR